MTREGLVVFPTTAREVKEGSVTSTCLWGKSETTMCISSTKTCHATMTTFIQHLWLQVHALVRTFLGPPTWLGAE